MQRGERVSRQRIWLSQEHAFGPVNLLVDWTRQEDTPRCVVLDQSADRRFWLGRDWLRRCLVLAKPIPVGFLVGLSACRCSARDRPQRGIIRC